MRVAAIDARDGGIEFPFRGEKLFEFFRHLFSTDFTPHAYCVRDSGLIKLHLICDSVIALSYFLIPFALWLLIRRRKDLIFPSMFVLFAIFIVGCGLTHVMAVVTLWNPMYRLDGLVKAITAAASIITAALLFRMLPEIVAFPSPQMLRDEIDSRKTVEEQLRVLNEDLERRVAERTAEFEATQQAASENDATLRALLESATQAVIGIDEAGNILLANGAAERLFGYSRDELLNGQLEMLIPERLRTQHAGHRARYFVTPRKRPMGQGLDLEARRKDGTKFPVEISLSYLETKQGLLAVAFVSDISARKTAEEALRESESRFRTLAEAVPNLLWATDASGRGTYVSARYAEYTGLDADHLLAAGWLSVVHPEDRISVEESWNAAVHTGQLYEVEYRLRRYDGHYGWFVTRGVPVRDECGHIKEWLGSSTDVDHLKRTQSALIRSNDDLRQFAYVAAHDLQEPLRNVTNCVQMLKRSLDGDGGPSGSRRWMDAATESTQRMFDLVKDLLSYSRLVAEQKTQPNAISANTVVSKVVYSVSSLIDQIHANISVGPLPNVLVLETHLTQLFQNLITNALKYRKPDLAPDIRIACNRHEDDWVFTVADNGIGFKPEYAEHIFGVFKRLHTRTQYEGNGIGLAICSRVVSHYGGRIWAKGQSGVGASFHFTLPVEEGVKSNVTHDDPRSADRRQSY